MGRGRGQVSVPPFVCSFLSKSGIGCDPESHSAPAAAPQGVSSLAFQNMCPFSLTDPWGGVRAACCPTPQGALTFLAGFLSPDLSPKQSPSLRFFAVQPFCVHFVPCHDSGRFSQGNSPVFLKETLAKSRALNLGVL